MTLHWNQAILIATQDAVPGKGYNDPTQLPAPRLLEPGSDEIRDDLIRIVHDLGYVPLQPYRSYNPAPTRVTKGQTIVVTQYNTGSWIGPYYCAGRHAFVLVGDIRRRIVELDRMSKEAEAKLAQYGREDLTPEEFGPLITPLIGQRLDYKCGESILTVCEVGERSDQGLYTYWSMRWVEPELGDYFPLYLKKVYQDRETGQTIIGGVHGPSYYQIVIFPDRSIDLA